MPEANKDELQQEKEEPKTIDEKDGKKLKKLVLPNDSNVTKGNI